ncbi:10883_t:CDS:2, partial [Funneliformis mosseae]
MLYPVTLSPTMPPKLRKKKKSPTAPKEDINVGTSSKGIEKPEKIVSPFPREPFTVSMEGVESTEIAPSTKDREKKEDLDIDDKHIQVIRDQEITGQAFLRLTEEKLMQDVLCRGLAESIASLVETLKGGEVTLKRKYEKSPEVLTEIVERAVEKSVHKEFSQQIPNKISVSSLSQLGMRKIIDDVGLKIIVFIDEDFQPIETISYNPFRGFHIADIHTQKNYQRHLREANITLTGGGDISIRPSETACIWIETKKKAKDFSEDQAIGDDHGVALAIIKGFVLEERMFLNELIGKDVTYEVKLPEPLKKKVKFLECIFEVDNEDRIADMVGDMSEQKLFNMTVCKRLMLVRDFCRLDEQPQGFWKNTTGENNWIGRIGGKIGLLK